MDRKGVEFSFASLTIVLTIITILIFILFGGNILFYVIAVIAIIVAILNGWILSNVDNKDFKVPFAVQKENTTSKKSSKIETRGKRR